MAPADERLNSNDTSTVRFDLAYGYGGFADILTDRQVKIVSADHIADLPTAPIGTVWPFPDTATE